MEGCQRCIHTGGEGMDPRGVFSPPPIVELGPSYSGV